MPFLDEVFQGVSDTSTHKSLMNKGKTSALKKIHTLYPTTEPAETGLLALRKVPNEILHHVPQQKVVSALGTGNTLKRNTYQGVQERAAIQSFKYSTAAMRLSNNMEIGVEAQGSLIG